MLGCNRNRRGFITHTDVKDEQSRYAPFGHGTEAFDAFIEHDSDQRIDN
jgi:hypothetical protein